jgi:hypothetical protein
VNYIAIKLLTNWDECEIEYYKSKLWITNQIDGVGENREERTCGLVTSPVETSFGVIVIE